MESSLCFLGFKMARVSLQTMFWWDEAAGSYCRLLELIQSWLFICVHVPIQAEGFSLQSKDGTRLPVRLRGLGKAELALLYAGCRRETS